MLHMLAKRNEKHACRRIWPDFTRCTHEEPRLPAERFFDARLVVGEGEVTVKTFHGKAWRDLVAESVDESGGAFWSRSRTWPG